MNSKAIGTTIIGSMMVMGGVDATQLNETPLEIQDTIAEEVVEVRQVENIVEATAPWKDQAGLTIKYDMGEPTLTEKLKDERKEQVIYDRVDFGDGSMKVDILLNEKPDTNRFCYQIEGAENYDFFYQPELTPEEIAEGASRPPEIVGSYAVYHKTLKNHVIGQENYATGKVMHIPRPQVWELGNEENKVWADLSYDAGQLCVTVPQDFLDKAAYPVRVDPTFGYTSAGASTFSYGATTAWSNDAVAPETGVVESMSASVSATGVGGNLAVAIYDGQSIPQSLLAQDSGNVSVGTSQSWVTLNISANITAGRRYWLSGWFDNSGCGCSTRIHYDAGTQTLSEKTSVSFETWPNPFSRTGSFSNFNLSIYATYSVPPYVPASALRINNGTRRINTGTQDL